MLTAELSEDEAGFAYRQLGERLARIKQRKDAADEAAEKRLRELQEIADEIVKRVSEPEGLYLTQPGEYPVFTVLQTFASTDDKEYLAGCARKMVAHLRDNGLLAAGWSASKGGRMRVNSPCLPSCGIRTTQSWASIRTTRIGRSWKRRWRSW
jgi:type I restriction enzyme R subunit